MIFKAMSRDQATDFTLYLRDESFIIISITDTNKENAIFQQSFELVDICRFKFDDVDRECDKNCMTDADAKAIIEFVKKHSNVDLCIVQCEGGISRSAGIAAALMLIFNGSDDEIFDNPRLVPNQLCYTKILQEFYGEVDMDMVETKMKHSAEIWYGNWI